MSKINIPRGNMIGDSLALSGFANDKDINKRTARRFLSDNTKTTRRRIFGIFIELKRNNINKKVLNRKADMIVEELFEGLVNFQKDTLSYSLELNDVRPAIFNARSILAELLSVDIEDVAVIVPSSSTPIKKGPMFFIVDEDMGDGKMQIVADGGFPTVIKDPAKRNQLKRSESSQKGKKQSLGEGFKFVLVIPFDYIKNRAQSAFSASLNKDAKLKGSALYNVTKRTCVSGTGLDILKAFVMAYARDKRFYRLRAQMERIFTAIIRAYEDNIIGTLARYKDDNNYKAVDEHVKNELKDEDVEEYDNFVDFLEDDMVFANMHPYDLISLFEIRGSEQKVVGNLFASSGIDSSIRPLNMFETIGNASIILHLLFIDRYLMIIINKILIGSMAGGISPLDKLVKDTKMFLKRINSADTINYDVAKELQSRITDQIRQYEYVKDIYLKRSNGFPFDYTYSVQKELRGSK